MAQPVIIQGEDRVVNVRLFDNETKLPLNITSATAITATLPGVTNPVAFTLAATEVAIVDGANGLMSITMSDTKTIDLKTGEPTMEVVVDFNTNRRIAQIEKSVLVKKKIFT